MARCVEQIVQEPSTWRKSDESRAWHCIVIDSVWRTDLVWLKQTTLRLDEGFHCYPLSIDGAQGTDLDNMFFDGCGRCSVLALDPATTFENSCIVQDVNDSSVFNCLTL